MAIGDLITGAGQAVSDLFGSEGSSAAANSYTGAATLATQNAQLAATSTRIQETQLARQVFQTEGSQIADVAGAGFTESGSALDLLRSTAQQGALAKSVTNIQGAINENSYAAQAGAYTAEAKAANEASNAGIVGAIGAIGGALLNNGASLVSAGKTVASGVNYVSSLFSSAPEVGTAFSGAAAASDAQALSGFLGPPTENSLLDSAINSGADLGSSIGTIGIDTSGVAIGSSADAVSSFIDNAISSFGSDISSGLSVAPEAISIGTDLASGDFLGALIDASPLGSFISDISSGNVLGAVGDVVGSVLGVFGSVICTAFYKRGFITRRVWCADQKYGARCSPTIFRGYYFWGKPVADGIMKYEWLALLFWPIFKPAIYEMAAKMGTGKSTIFGCILLKVCLGLSFILGALILKGERNAIKFRTTSGG